MILRARAICALFLLLMAGSAFAQDFPVAPTAPDWLAGPSSAKKSELLAASAPGQFSIGNPTDDEQLLLELINRARVDASAEALRLIALNEPFVQGALLNVNTNLMKAQFATNPPTGPLSFNGLLIAAARGHSQYLFENALQSHFGPGTNQTLVHRLGVVGYNFKAAGENVFSFSQNSEHGHAAFEVDWNGGTADGGMQLPPGHRNSIHSAAFKEIGIGVVFGSNTVITPTRTNTVGPMIITQDFATPPADIIYITGVAYYDRNGNNFYDLGEGSGGVRVTVDGLATFAVTTASGGYSIPVTPNDNYTVRFNAPGLNEVVTQTVVTSANRKIDLLVPITPTTITSVPSITFAGVSNLYSISPFAAATAYRAAIQRISALPLEGAEGSLTNVTLNITGSYSPISTTIRASDARGFRLAHTNNLMFPGLQSIEFNRPVFIRPGALVSFMSRLGLSSSNQVARVEVSEDRQTWTAVWTQFGNQISGGPDTSEKTFTSRTVPLDAYIGKVVYVRFTYSFASLGSYFALTGSGMDNLRGWYIDDILFTNALQADDPAFVDIGPDPLFRFAPPAVGEYIVKVQSFNNTRIFPFGPAQYANVQANPPVVTLVNNPTFDGASMSFDFTVEGTVTPFALDSSANPDGPWTPEPAANFTGPVAGHYTVSVPANGSQRFYRVRAN